jgi:hypothetical protein
MEVVLLFAGGAICCSMCLWVRDYVRVLEVVDNVLHVLEVLEGMHCVPLHMLEVVESVCFVPESHARCSPLLEVIRCCAKGHIALHRFLVFSHLHTYIAASHSLLV